MRLHIVIGKHKCFALTMQVCLLTHDLRSTVADWLSGFGCTGTSASAPASTALPIPSTAQNAHAARKAELSDDEDQHVWTQAAATAKQRGNEKYQRAEHQQAVQLYTVRRCRCISANSPSIRHTFAHTKLHLQATAHQCCHAGTWRHHVNSACSLWCTIIAGI